MQGIAFPFHAKELNKCLTAILMYTDCVFCTVESPAWLPMQEPSAEAGDGSGWNVTQVYKVALS